MKVSFLIPNSSKQAMIYGTECFKMADDFAEFVIDAKARGSIDKEQYEKYKEKAEVLYNQVDVVAQSKQYELTYCLHCYFLSLL